MSKQPEFDVAIIGAGVVGLSIAHFLSKTEQTCNKDLNKQAGRPDFGDSRCRGT